MLAQASHDGDLNLVKQMIKEGADINYKDQNNSTPLILAAANYHTDIVEYLLKMGAKTDYDYGNIYYAWNNKKMVRILREPHHTSIVILNGPHSLENMEILANV
jgi:hypothetical protein